MVNLYCNLCGEIAAQFVFDKLTSMHTEDLVYRGLTHSREIGKRRLKKISRFVNSNSFLKLHKLMQKLGTPEGLDAYCPQCNAVYCREHYRMHVSYDEGFYDSTSGVCPYGHERIIDD